MSKNTIEISKAVFAVTIGLPIALVIGMVVMYGGLIGIGAIYHAIDTLLK
jgi:hypothetical protein